MIIIYFSFFREKQPQRLLTGSSAYAMFEKHGSGGWRSDSLGAPYVADDYDVNPHCGVDMLNASLVTADEVTLIYIK
jgi:hypothetical protein